MVCSVPEDLSAAVQALELFCRTNWTQRVKKDDGVGSNSGLLAFSGEEIYPLTKQVELFQRASNVLLQDDVSVDFASDESICRWWWAVRCAWIGLRLLENPASCLQDRLIQAIDRVVLKQESLPWWLLCEASLIASMLGNRDEQAEGLLKRSADAASFSYDFTGVLGRRLVHQRDSVSQLVIQAGSSSAVGQGSGPSSPSQNKGDSKFVQRGLEVQLRGDADSPSTVQDVAHLDFVQEDTRLGYPGTCILLAHVQLLTRSSAEDSARLNRCRALVERVLAELSPQDESSDNDKEGIQWSLMRQALYQRSYLEGAAMRRQHLPVRLVERAALQMQALVQDLDSPTSSDNGQFLWQVDVLPAWELERHQALMFATLGLFRTALECFERLRMPSDRIACLVQLGQEREALDLIQQELQSSDISKFQRGTLLCILADLKSNDPALYEQAWKECQSARALRSLGRLAFRAEKWQEARGYLGEALCLNASFEYTAMLLGLACVQLGEWQEALGAFSRVLSLNPQNPDAWNNLGLSHSRMQAWRPAADAFSQAARAAARDGSPEGADSALLIWDNVATAHLQLLASLDGGVAAEESVNRICECLGQMSLCMQRIASSAALYSPPETPKRHFAMVASIIRKLMGVASEDSGLPLRLIAILKKTKDLFGLRVSEYWHLLVLLLSSQTGNLELKGDLADALWQEYRLRRADLLESGKAKLKPEEFASGLGRLDAILGQLEELGEDVSGSRQVLQTLRMSR